MPVAIATPEVSVESLGRVFGWAVVHAIAFIAARKWTTPSIFKSRHYDTNYWTSSVISTVHAIIMCFNASRMIARDEVEIWGGGYDRAVPEWERSIEFSAGYFVYDFVFMMLPSTACEESPSKEMLFHHVVSIQTHYWPVCVCKYGIAMSVVGYLAELSTPFANARWMLKEAGGGTGTAVYLANGALLTVSFFLCRICAVGFLLYMMFVAHPRFTGGLSLGTAMGGGLGHIVAPLTVAFYCLNLVWMWKIGRGMVRAMRNKGQKGAK